jgi:transcriptional regulator with XRE-family HTH domain
MIRVKLLRTRKGWTQSQLAHLTGLSIDTIRHIEQGRNTYLQNATRDALGDALGVSRKQRHRLLEDNEQ